MWFLKSTTESPASRLAGHVQTSQWPLASAFKEEGTEGDTEQEESWKNIGKVFYTAHSWFPRALEY